jgi:hypothetical protein
VKCIPCVSQKADIGAFEQFVDSFDLAFLWKYVVGKSFDFYRYAADIKSGALLAPKGVRPLFGNLYLPHNVEVLTRTNPKPTHGRSAWEFADGCGLAFAGACVLGTRRGFSSVYS